MKRKYKEQSSSRGKKFILIFNFKDFILGAADSIALGLGQYNTTWWVCKQRFVHIITG